MEKKLLCLLLFLCIGTWARSQVIHIRGKISPEFVSEFGDTVYILHFGLRKTALPSSQEIFLACPIKNGVFKFDIPQQKTQEILIGNKGYLNYPHDKAHGFKIIGVSGETLKIKWNKQGYKISGSKYYQAVGKMESTLGADNGKRNASEVIAYIKSNPKSEACVEALQYLNFEDLKKAISFLDVCVKEGRMKSFIANIVASKEHMNFANKQAIDKKLYGRQAPDFILNDANDQSLSLSSYLGHFVILDFWASWCGACVNGLGEMKKYYDKYKDKFEIIGINYDYTIDKFKSAVKRYELPWKNVFAYTSSSKKSPDFGVRELPTKIIIGPDGKIVNSFEGEGPYFYQFLDKLFGRK